MKNKKLLAAGCLAVVTFALAGCATPKGDSTPAANASNSPAPVISAAPSEAAAPEIEGLPAASPDASAAPAGDSAPAQSSTQQAVSTPPSESAAQASAVSPDNAATAETAAQAAPSADTAIDDTAAKAIALEHAGIEEANADWLNIHIDRDDGRQIYEVEFYSDSTEYNYDIDATTGEIISYDMEQHNRRQATQAGAVIDEAEAKQKALDRVEGASDSDIRIHLDYDDGVAVYEGTIIYDNMKYEFEMNASDGTITDWEVESVFN